MIADAWKLSSCSSTRSRPTELISEICWKQVQTHPPNLLPAGGTPSRSDRSSRLTGRDFDCQAYPTHSYGTRRPSRGSRRTRPAATSRASARDTLPTGISSAFAISDVVATPPSSPSARPTWLDLAHRKLDEALFAAYGWLVELGDEKILGRLPQLNLQRAAASPPNQTAALSDQ
jgi:hypothetical protein